MRRPSTPLLALALAFAWVAAAPAGAHGQERRPVSYGDLFRHAAVGDVAISPDGRHLLYTLTPGAFPERTRPSRIHLATLDGRVDRPLTQPGDGADRNPRWHPSGEVFAFTSTRGGQGRQLYLMRPDGGEAVQVTDVRGGIADWGWSHDGRWLAYLAGRGKDRQVRVMDGRGVGESRRLTDHPTPVSSFAWRERANEILFTAAEAWDEADHRRRGKGFRARTIQRGLVFDDFLVLHPTHLWRQAPDGARARRITSGDLVVHRFLESPRGDRIALVAGPVDPHADTRTHEVYLVDPDGARLERLTENHVPEQILSFSPDGSRLAITAGKDFTWGGINEIWVRPVAGGEWTAVTAGYDREVADAVWSEDGRSLFFVGRDGVNRQLYEVELRSGAIRRRSDLTGVVSIQNSEPGPVAVIGFADPRNPEDLYAVRWRDLGNRNRWTRLTRANPWAESVRLAETRTIRWGSPDGTEVEGLLVLPLDHDPSRRYPLITEIHGGPASAFENTFLPTSASPHRAYGHLLAARGYALFLPNYRGSSNYGDRFRTEIAGDYWTRATEDIHAGIDHIIAMGIAHPDSLGFMGWSAGGHWSNWMLVTTDRFRAIATGAGVTNWISLYGQTDNQASREFYLGRDPALGAANKPWDDFDHWWAESPLRYIRNARTPTLIHFPERDQRVPMPQGQELHMALKSLNVPTEFIVYPNELHALRDPRNQLVKLLADLGWFDRWIRGAETWFDWGYVLEAAESIERSLADPTALPGVPAVAGSTEGGDS
jgi:dipeptidyl aminopeptidase/acylaminoacyl peptidase